MSRWGLIVNSIVVQVEPEERDGGEWMELPDNVTVGCCWHNSAWLMPPSNLHVWDATAEDWVLTAEGEAEAAHEAQHGYLDVRREAMRTRLGLLDSNTLLETAIDMLEIMMRQFEMQRTAGGAAPLHDDLNAMLNERIAIHNDHPAPEPPPAE